MCCCFRLALSFRTILDGQKNTHTLFWQTKPWPWNMCSELSDQWSCCHAESLPSFTPLATPSSIASVQIYTPAKRWVMDRTFAVDVLAAPSGENTGRRESWIPTLVFTGVLEWQSSAALTRKSHFTHRTTSVCCIQAHEGDGSAEAAQKWAVSL